MSAWFKCFPERILESYDQLDSDQRAAAYTLTMLIYQHDGPLALSEANLAGRCGFNLRKYRRVIAELMALGKFYVTPSGSLSNERADELLEHRRAARDFGSVGGKKRAANARSKKIDREQTGDQFRNSDEKDKANNVDDQGSLDFGFKYKDRDSSVPKGTGAEAPPNLSDADYLWKVGAPWMESRGHKTARSFLGGQRKLVSDQVLVEIINAAMADNPGDAVEWIAKAVQGRKGASRPTAPTVALCRLGEFRWCHDWATGENFTTDAEGKHELGRSLTAAELAEVARAVDAAQTMRRAA